MDLVSLESAVVWPHATEVNIFTQVVAAFSAEPAFLARDTGFDCYSVACFCWSVILLRHPFAFLPIPFLSLLFPNLPLLYDLALACSFYIFAHCFLHFSSVHMHSVSHTIHLPREDEETERTTERKEGK